MYWYLFVFVLQVELLRLNDFMAIIVDANQDYHNNGGDTTVTTELAINTLLFVGGVTTATITGEIPLSTLQVGVNWIF